MQCALAAGCLTFESSVAVNDLSAVTTPCLPIRWCDIKILSAILGVYVCLFVF